MSGTAAGEVADAGEPGAGEAVAGSVEAGDEVVGCVEAGGAAVVFGACARHAAETATSITDNFVQNSFMNNSLLP